MEPSVMNLNVICPQWARIIPKLPHMGSKKLEHYTEMLKNSQQCVVGEAYGWKCGYALSEKSPRYGNMVKHCDECARFASTKVGIPSCINKPTLPLILSEFVEHFEHEHYH